jgi:hypothetical protein
VKDLKKNSWMRVKFGANPDTLLFGTNCRLCYAKAKRQLQMKGICHARM